MKLRDGKLRGSFRDGEIHHDELSNQSLDHDICRANAWMIEVLTTTKGTIRDTFFICFFYVPQCHTWLVLLLGFDTT